MAREMYLVGVSEDELKPTPPPERPNTPAERLKHFWFYYKWWVLAILALALLVGITLWQSITTPQPDYQVVLVTRDVLDEAAVKGLAASMQTVAFDLNGDGRVLVDVENLPLAQYVGGTTYGMAETNTQKLMAYFVSADAMFYVFDDACYTRYLHNLMDTAEDGSAAFFAAPGFQAKGIDPIEHYWNWKDDARRQTLWGEQLPEDLYFGVRALGGTASGEAVTQRYVDCMQLLQAYIENE